MALWIQNISDPMPEDNQVHTYRLMIGETELAQFKHIRNHGAAQCLRLAADALIESEKDVGPAVEVTFMGKSWDEVVG